MERRGLNIRKGFLKAVLPVFRALPLPMASRVVSGIGRLEYRLSPSLRQIVRRGGCAGTNGARRETGTRVRSAASLRATTCCGGRETCCWTGFPTNARSRCLPWRVKSIWMRRWAGEGMHRAGQPLRGPSAAGALALPGELSGSVSTWSVRGIFRGTCRGIFRPTGRSGRTSCSFRGREFRPTRRARSSAPRGRSERGCCCIWRATSAGPGG